MDFDSFWDGTKTVAGKVGEVATNLITFGGKSALDKSSRAYGNAYLDHATSRVAYEAARVAFDAEVSSLGEESVECVKLLREAGNLVSRLSDGCGSSNLPNLRRFTAPDIREISKAIADFDAAATAGQGAGIGAATSTGAWVLVAHFGTASTGAAISGLAGAAAHSAILAWFGGGALAAGGGGMALGGLVVGGLVVLPFVAYSSFRSYKESLRIDAEREKADEATVANHSNAGELNRLKVQAEILRQEFRIQRDHFLTEFATVRDETSRLAQRLAASANYFASELNRTK